VFAATEYPVQFAFLKSFRKEAPEIWNEEEIGVLCDYIALNPEAGDVIRGTNGVRKLRWRYGNRGKSTGARVLYHFRDLNMPIYMMAVYTKSQRHSLSRAETNEFRRLVDDIVKAHSEIWLRIVSDQQA
jgi:hypothetical protein